MLRTALGLAVVTTGALGLLLSACAEQHEAPPPEEPAPAVVGAARPTGPTEHLEIHADGAVLLASCTGKVGFRGDRSWSEVVSTPSTRTASHDSSSDAGPPKEGGRTTFKDCFRDAIAHGGADEVRLSLRFDVDDSGAPTVHADHGCATSEGLRACLVASARDRRFDPRTRSFLLPVSVHKERDSGLPPSNEILVDPIALRGCAAMLGEKTGTAATFEVHGADVRIDGWRGDPARLKCVARALQQAGGDVKLEVEFVE